MCLAVVSKPVAGTFESNGHLNDYFAWWDGTYQIPISSLQFNIAIVILNSRALKLLTTKAFAFKYYFTVGIRTVKIL